MALKRDPKTGLMVDDGLPDPEEAAAPAPVMQTMFPPKPAFEQTVSTEQRTPSAQSQAAAVNVAVASGAKANAQEALGHVEGAEAGVRADAAGNEVTELERAKIEAERFETERVQFKEEAQAAAKERIEKIAKDKITAGRARADEWKGNAGGEMLAAFLRGIDRAASSFRGETGPTGVDRIFEAKTDAHEKALVAEWEASKEAHELKSSDVAAYEVELEKRRLNAHMGSAAELKVYAARRDKAIAALGPERAKALGDMAKANDAAAEARLDQHIGQSLDKITKLEQTKREGGTATAPSPGPPPVDERTVLDPDSGQPIGLAPSKLEGRQSRTGYGALEGLRGWRERMGAFFQKNGVAFNEYKPETSSDFDALRTEAAGYLTVLNESGVLNTGEFERYSKVVAPTGLISLFKTKEAALSGLDQVMKGADGRYRSKVKAWVPSYGLTVREKVQDKINGPTAKPAAWKPENKTITSGTYKRTGPGDNDWEKIK